MLWNESWRRKSIFILKKLNDIIDRLSKLNLQAEAVDSIKRLKEEIEDINTLQLEKGKQPNDSIIKPDYSSESYANFKRSISSGSGKGKYTPDLKLSGDFHKSITVKFYDTYLEIISKDKKAQKLLNKYGSILGIPKQGRADISKTIKEDLHVILKVTLKK